MNESVNEMRLAHPRILHVNVRLMEGGAASIARDLHSRLSSDGYVSRLAYGYGHGGKVDPMEFKAPGCFRVSSTGQVALNIATSRLMGSEVLAAGSVVQREMLVNEIAAADIVHLHCIHSYFTDPLWLLSILADARKPVVWTAHDHWLVTGRCAVPGSCEGWRHGCGRCPTRINYPPSLFDFSRQRFLAKRKVLQQISDLHIVTPGKHMLPELRAAFPGVKVSVVHNGLDCEFERCLAGISDDEGNGQRTTVPRVLVVAANLSDPQKSCIPLITNLVASGSYTVHTVGAHSPYSGTWCVNHGVVSSRSELVALYSNVDALLFTSRVDTFGMVVAEALTCGLPVVALSSPAADEVVQMVGGRTLMNIHDLMDTLSSCSWWNLYPHRSKESLMRDSLAAFSGESMCRAYESVYAQVWGK